MSEDRSSITTADTSSKLWRYMSFGRFVWLLQKHQLWLSRADLLGDPWEIALAGDQLSHVISRHPPYDIYFNKTRESAMERSGRIIRSWRRHTFVNCWSASDHESHALWRIYCRSSEGVAIQTTFSKLHDSVKPCSVLPVTYEVGKRKVTPTLIDLVSKKRPMFAYEHEVRVVRHDESKTSEKNDGYRLPWDAERHVESIRVHPESDESFMETVIGVVQSYAPNLSNAVACSDMKAKPPF